MVIRILIQGRNEIVEASAPKLQQPKIIFRSKYHPSTKDFFHDYANSLEKTFHEIQNRQKPETQEILIVSFLLYFLF